MTTTDLYGYGHYTHQDTPRDTVLEFLGDQAEDFNVDGLVDAYRDAINVELSGSGITLNGSLFIGPYPVPANATELIMSALAAVDLGTLAVDYDTSS